MEQRQSQYTRADTESDQLTVTVTEPTHWRRETVNCYMQSALPITWLFNAQYVHQIGFSCTRRSANLSIRWHLIFHEKCGILEPTRADTQN